MKAFYFESSALVKRYLDEDGSDCVREVLARKPLVVSAVITRVEVAAAVARATRDNRVTKEEADAALQTFRQDWQDVMRVQLVEAVIERAAELAQKHRLRAYDAVHLAAALCWKEWAGLELWLASFDEDLRAAARSEELPTWPDNTRTDRRHLA
ncbi:MAG: type II toxin-antitoxin system VapC family toxin [Desulfurococcaceae archaeon]